MADIPYGPTEKIVVTYQRAPHYGDQRITLCQECEAKTEYSLGPVSHGSRLGVCDLCGDQ
jgi:hypothetical protein